MTTKSKTLLIVLGTLIIGIAIGALGSGALRYRRAKEFERMMSRDRFHTAMEKIIRPTDEQRDAIEQILDKHSEQMSEIREKHQEEIFATFDSLRVELGSVLTEEQLIRLETELAKGENRQIGRGIRRLTRELQLDDSQQQRIEEIMQSMREEMKADRRNYRGNWSDFRQEMKRRIEKSEEEIEAILTPEQIEKYREIRKHRRPPFGHPHRRRMRDQDFPR